jgi:hypothetical protein
MAVRSRRAPPKPKRHRKAKPHGAPKPKPKPPPPKPVPGTPVEGAPYAVTLEARDSGHRVTGILGDKPPTPKEGGGGWEEVALPKRAGVLVWKGRSLMKLSFSLAFDNSDVERPVHADYLTLIHMFRPDNPDEEPPVIQGSSSGDVIPFLGANLEWVVSELEWLEGMADNQARRIQTVFLVTLTEYRADERLKTAEQTPKPPTKPFPYKIQRKDIAEGLSGIARRFKVKGGWKAIVAANRSWKPPRRDPRLTVKDVGRTITIPVPVKHKR